MLLISILLGLEAYALTLESDCRKIAVNPDKVEMSSIDPKKCTINKIFPQGGMTFFSSSINSDEYVFLNRQIDDAFFCKMPFDYLGYYNVAKRSKKETWNSKSAFVSLVRMTNEGGVIRRNSKESQVKKLNFCNAFPAFFKVRTVPKGVMSESLINMKNGGYLMLSSRFSALYFFGLELNKIEFVFNIPGDVQVEDAIIRKNGELVVLSSNGYELVDKKREECIDRWDLITGTMIRTRCGLKSYHQQVLIDGDKLTKAYIKNKVLYFEKFNENLISKTIPITKVIGDFNLNSAFVYED